MANNQPLMTWATLSCTHKVHVTWSRRSAAATVPGTLRVQSEGTHTVAGGPAVRPNISSTPVHPAKRSIGRQLGCGPSPRRCKAGLRTVGHPQSSRRLADDRPPKE